MPVLNCRHFNGYKPCGKNEVCSDICASRDLVGARILLVHLGALGAVVRSTALLPAIRRRYPGAHITWVTDRPGDLLLRAHPLVDRVLTTTPEDLLALSALRFDVGLVVDKSLKATGVIAQTECDVVLGFGADRESGVIIPLNAAAEEAWGLGLSNHQKFFVNKKTESQLMHEALELGPWQRDDYSLFLTRDEEAKTEERHHIWSAGGVRKVIGFNTGCAATIPYKKLSIDNHVEIIERLAHSNREELSSATIVLLGGKEDSDRNQTIAARARNRGIKVLESPTELGLRDGMISVAACDVVITGDSLGMHMAIGFHKEVIAWFGPTCAHEIDLYGRGEAILTKAPCSPCWKRACDKPVMCYDQIEFQEVISAVERSVERIQAKVRPHSPGVAQPTA